LSLHPILAAARGPFGERRFYPPGQHPATIRQRRQLAMLATLPNDPSRRALEDHLLAELATFEEGESVEKARYLQASRGFA
jgi:hypothetical protein